MFRFGKNTYTKNNCLTSNGHGVSWRINKNAMIAIIPNPSNDTVYLYTTYGNKYIIQFVRNVDSVQINMFVEGQDNNKENIFVATENVPLEHAQNFWKSLVGKDVPYPESLTTYKVQNDRGFSKSVLFVSVILSLGIGFSLGFLALDRSWLQSFFGAGKVVTGQNASSGLRDESGSPSKPAQAPREGNSTSSPSTIASSSSVASASMMTSSVSPSLRDISSGNRDMPDIQQTSPSPMPSLELDVDLLIALRELREVLQRGGRVDEALFRRLPQDIQDSLRAEGLAPTSSAPPTANEGSRRPEVRAPTNPVLRGETDVQGVPVTPRRLPQGESPSLAIPMPGGGNIREAEDFQAFGLQAPRLKGD